LGQGTGKGRHRREKIAKIQGNLVIYNIAKIYDKKNILEVLENSKE